MRAVDKRKNISQSRLNKFAEQLQEEDQTTLSFSVEPPVFQKSIAKKKLRDTTLLSSSAEIVPTSKPDNSKNWRYAVASAGNNIFGQSDATASFADMNTLFSPCMATIKATDKIYASYNMTAVVSESGEGQLIGSGLPNMQSKLYSPIIPIRNIRHVSCGQNHVACINTQCEVFTWGSDECGCLGHGKRGTIAIPKKVECFEGISIIHVSCGGYHTAFVGLGRGDTSYGDVYTCGQGTGGQLGLGETILSSSTPARIGSLLSSGFKANRVSCGMHHTLILAINVYDSILSRLRQHSVFACGFGESGRLGLGEDCNPHFTPELVAFPLPFHPIYMGAGESHSVAASNDTCYSWGNNELCQLGTGLPADVMPMSVMPVKIAIPEGLEIIRLTVGARHSGISTKCGRLLTWGWNEEGQCGHGNTALITIDIRTSLCFD